MPKDYSWLSNQKSENTLKELMEWARLFATIKRKTKEGSKIWVQDKILEGVATTRIDGYVLS